MHMTYTIYHLSYLIIDIYSSIELAKAYKMELASQYIRFRLISLLPAKS